jgi:hypothetical protein
MVKSGKVWVEGKMAAIECPPSPRVRHDHPALSPGPSPVSHPFVASRTAIQVRNNTWAPFLLSKIRNIKAYVMLMFNICT